MADDRDDDDLRRKLDAIEDPLAKIQAIADDASEHHAPSRETVERHEDRTDKAALRAERLENSGVKAAITPADFDRIVRGDSSELYPTYALSVTRAWWQCFTGQRQGRHYPFTLLYGQTGRGKTVAGAYMIGEMGGLYVEASELREVMTGGHWTAKRRELVLTSRFTMVDDLGTEKNDEDAQIALYSFVNRRQGLRKGLSLLTGNLGLRVIENGVQVPEKGLLTRYDERTIRRIEHSGRLVEATGADLRSGGQ